MKNIIGKKFNLTDEYKPEMLERGLENYADATFEITRVRLNDDGDVKAVYAEPVGDMRGASWFRLSNFVFVD